MGVDGVVGWFETARETSPAMWCDNEFLGKVIEFGVTCSDVEVFSSVGVCISPGEDIIAPPSADSAAVAVSEIEDAVMPEGTHNVASSCPWLSTSEIPMEISMVVMAVVVAEVVAVSPMSLPGMSGIGITSGDV